MSALSAVLSTRVRRRRNLGEGVLYATECTELIPPVKIETIHPVEGIMVMNFHSINNHCRFMAAWSRKMLKNLFLRFFRKTVKHDPLYIQNSVPKGFITTLIDVLWLNFTKFGRREIGKIVRCLPDKNFAWLSSCWYCADRAQYLPGQATDNVLRVLQISSKSVQFWRSYIRTREDRQSALKSEYNIRLKPGAEE